MYIFNLKASDLNNTRHNNGFCKTNFRGKLEQSFFEAVRKGNRSEQLKTLHFITFDVFEQDVVTGNNFLHVVCKENSEELFKKAKRILSYNTQKVGKLIRILNKENKTPLEYLENESFRLFINNLISKNSDGENIDKSVIIAPVAEELKEVPTREISNIQVGNEVSEKIDIDDFNFEIEDDIVETKPTKKGLESIIGHENLKQIFKEEIIVPIKNNKNVFTNGFLLHGLSGNGKTHAVEKLAEELNRGFVSATYLLTQKDSDKVSETINNNIIKVDTDEMRDILAVASLLKENYRKTQQQGFVFLDEIKNHFNENNLFSVKAAQAIENSAKNGMVLLATTRNKDNIDSEILNSLRFEKIIELSFPNSQDIYSYLREELPMLTNEEIKVLAKKTRGFSYQEVTRFIDILKNKQIDMTFEKCDSELIKYAEKNSFTDFSDEGSTINYDTFLKRTRLSVNDPKSLEDVAGMDEVKTKLKKIFEPIKKVDLLKTYFLKNKVKRPNGVLLYGPPGCGKTFIMLALSGETKLPLYQVKLSDVGSSFVNESEKNIKKVFDQLRKKYKETGEPSILFFDECDTFFSKKSANSDVSQKLLNTLKEEMNNAGDDGIFIVAATNEKDDLNSAIIRDGRFDTKIEVGYPDDKARYALISKQLSYPVIEGNISEEKIEELVQITKNLSNATIAGIFSTLKYERANILPDNIKTEADAEKFFKEHPIEYDSIKKSINQKREEINKTNLKQKDKTNLDWQGKTVAYDEVLSRTFYGKSDPKSLDDVIGMDEVKSQIKNKILAPLNPIIKEIFKKNNLPLTSGIVLHGPGGVGKTFIIKAAAAESRVPVYEMKMSEIGSSYANETSKNVQAVFNQLKRKFAETGEPSILFLDECDSILGKVGDSSSDVAKERNNILNTLKTELAVALENGIIVVAATNNYKDLDPTVIRSGRFSEHIAIGYPNKEARVMFIKNLLNKREITLALGQDEDFVDKLANMTENMSNADLKEIIDSALIKSHESFITDILKAFKTNVLNEEYKLNPEPPSKELILEIALRKQKEVQTRRGYDENF